MLADLDRKRLSDGLAVRERAVSLIVHPAKGRAEANQRLAEVAREFEVAAGGGLVVRPGDGRGLPALPALTIKAGERSNIRYLALPEGHEAAPFIDALIELAGGAPSAGDLEAGFQDLSRPVDVLVFIASACPHCPRAVRSALQLALASDEVTVTVVDAQLFEDLAGRFKVRSVPMTVIDEGYSFVGVKTAVELAGKVLDSDGEEAQARVFESMIETGRFEDAAARMTAGPGLVHFLASWKKSTIQVRMGLMLTAEQVFSTGRDAMDALVPDLLPLLEVGDAALRGDTADLLGQIGHESAAGPLKRLLDDPNPDVAEIAEEALDGIMERN